MVDLALLQSVSYIAGAIGVSVAAAYYMITLRNNNRNREAQLFTQIFQTFISSGIGGYGKEVLMWEWKDFDDFFKKYGGDVEKFSKYSAIEMYFEGLGVLVYQKLIKPEFIEEFLGGDVIEYWEKMRPINKGQRESNNPRWGEFQEYLINELKQIRAKRQPMIDLPYTK